MAASGYCHFNENENNTTFTIDLFGIDDICLIQNPGSRTLGHGAVVWDAAAVFVKYMEKHSKEFDNKKLVNSTVLELGSGCGLSGVAFMMKGAKVTFTDLEKVTTNVTERNVKVRIFW